MGKRKLEFLICTFAILVSLSSINGGLANAGKQGGTSVDDVSTSVAIEASTPTEISQPITAAPPNITTTSTTTEAPKPPAPTTKPPAPTTKTPPPTTPSSTTPTPTSTTPTPTSTTPTPTPSSTTPSPHPTTVSPPTPTPNPNNRGFDLPSFVGGIILALGVLAIGYVVYKFYRARTDPNYRAL